MTGISNPFPGPRPYGADDESRFYGREDEERAMRSAVIVQRCVTIYGPSGCGKSSLLEAKILPNLRRAGYRAMSVNGWPREESLVSRLLALMHEQLEGGATSPAARRDAPLVILLDQLEQLLTRHASADVAAFVEYLDDLLAGARQERHLVLSIREDYLGRWRAAVRGRARLVDNWLRLGPLTVKGIADSVCTAAKERGSPAQRWDEGEVCALLRQVRAPGEPDGTDEAEVQAAYAQIVCRELFADGSLDRGRPRAPGREPLVAAPILRRYLDDTLATLGRLREPALLLLEEHLIDPTNGTRRLLTEAQAIGQHIGVPDEDVRTILGHLEAAVILRAQEHQGSRYYELGHDWLAQKVFELRRDREKEEAEREAERARGKEEERRRKEQEDLARKARLEADVARSRTRVWQLAFSLIFLLLVGCIAVGALISRQYQRDANFQRDKRVQSVRGRLASATTDEEVKAIASQLDSDGIRPVEVRDAAIEYWNRRAERLERSARDFDSAGCVEEAAVVRAFAAAGGAPGDAGAPAPPAPELAAVLWLPAPSKGTERSSEATEVERCKARRASTCDRVVLADDALSASCSGKLEVFHPGGPQASIDGLGSLRAPLASDGGWSIGADGDAVVINHGATAARLPACAAQDKHVTDLQVLSADMSAAIAYVCDDGTYGTRSIADLGSWFAGRASTTPRSSSGYRVSAVAWVGGRLLTAKPGPDGRVELEDVKGIAVPYVTALAGSVRFAVVGTESFSAGGTTMPPVLGVLAPEHGELVWLGKWPLGICNASSCILRAVAGADEGHAAGLLVSLPELEQPRVWLVLSRSGDPRAIEIAGENVANLVSLSVGTWRGQVVAAVPEAGRVRLYAWDPEADASWSASQRRLGLTIRFDRKVRVERLDAAGPQPALRFDEVFPDR